MARSIPSRLPQQLADAVGNEKPRVATTGDQRPQIGGRDFQLRHGIKYFPWWFAPLNPWVYLKNRGYNGTPGELRTPWDQIAPRLLDWHVTPVQFGMGYIGIGRVALHSGAAPLSGAGA